MKKFAVTSNIILLIWYALAMTGLRLGDKYLVEQSFADEWIFMTNPL